MKITLDVPSVSCARCSAEAPVRPQLLYPFAGVAPAFRGVMQEVSKADLAEGTDVLAEDSAGQVWKALMTERPIGWTALPTGERGLLCTDCTAAWLLAAKSFMTPPPPPVVVEEPAAVAAPPSTPAPELNFSGSKPSPFKQPQGHAAQRTASPFQQPAGVNVSGPQNVIHGAPSSPNKITVKR